MGKSATQPPQSWEKSSTRERDAEPPEVPGLLGAAAVHALRAVPSVAWATYLETGRERDSPRGRISLMRAIADGGLGATKGFADEMSYCLGCLACTTSMPAGCQQRRRRYFEAGRAQAERSGASSNPIRSFIRFFTLRFLLFRPWALRLAGRLMWLYEASRLRGLVRASGILAATFSEEDRRAQAPGLSDPTGVVSKMG